MVLGIYGTHGSGRELEEMVAAYPELHSRWTDVVFIDDTQEACILRGHAMMPFEDFSNRYTDAEIAIAVGEPFNRELLYNKVKEKGYGLATIISPRATLSPSARIGEGVIVKDHSLVSADATIGDNVWIQSNTIIGHGDQIHENCQISAFVFVGGNTVIGRNTFVGASAAIREDLHIGQNAVVSMGAIVLKDIQEGRVVMGNPAREISDNAKHKVFKR